jgi:hypothetical protein
MATLTRREVLKVLSMMLPASVVRCSRNDVFQEERVCVHVYDHEIALPEPLLQKYKDRPSRPTRTQLFNIGISELVLCSTPASFVKLFQYFWPIARAEFQQVHHSITIQYQEPTLAGRETLDKLKGYLENVSSAILSNEKKTALLMNLNDHTKYWTADLLEIWRVYKINEFVVFKDPTKSPYLCDYLALQKGFKRPPP